ncbi:Lsr2 protein [Microlunatus soli]|uniref:Lsr2 protein n=2 Tax=Microlunatus soli TaxID=630515 RepID=A0A1H1VXM8_9ACTN|nr:Lsr2 protein [Microlunatus soli]
MIQRVQTLYIDDCDGQSAADETVQFALDGVNYEIDLTSANAAELRALLQPWRDRGRKVARAGRRQREANGGKPNRPHRATRIDPAQSRAIREWAAANDMPISSRGKIPTAVHQAYDAAHA